MKNPKSGIQKYHLWLAFFFLIFGGTFSMIIWTVKSAVATPVYDDKAFLSSYHDVDDNFNKMMINNYNFNKKYEVQIKINDRRLGMEIKDSFLGQRSLEKQSTNQNIFSLGKNNISIVISEKQSKNIITNAKIKMQITRAIEDMYDIDLNNFKLQNDVYKSSATIERKGNWNVIGTIEVDSKIGYFYIKTSTKK